MAERPPCTFGDSFPAVVRIELSEGCVARRDDRVQDLCAQHFSTCDPIGDMRVVEEYADTSWMR